MFETIGRLIRKGAKIASSIDTGTWLKIGAGAALLVGGSAIMMVANDGELLLEEGDKTIELPDSEVEVKDKDISEEVADE